MNIPNAVTLFRIAMVPVAIWLIINNQPALAFWVFLLAGVSDGIDGYVAKRFDQETTLGRYLDPMADKLLLVSLVIALGILEQVPSWLVLCVVFRDGIMLAAILLAWMLDNPVDINPIAISKLNTALQIILVAVVLADWAFGFGLDTLRLILGWCTGLTTVVSAVIYLHTWIRHMTHGTDHHTTA
ncbi:MAG: CDP-alcohol phosphatidyltransferase family protein [Pseudomonadota bacterium]